MSRDGGSRETIRSRARFMRQILLDNLSSRTTKTFVDLFRDFMSEYGDDVTERTVWRHLSFLIDHGCVSVTGEKHRGLQYKKTLLPVPEVVQAFRCYKCGLRGTTAKFHPEHVNAKKAAAKRALRASRQSDSRTETQSEDQPAGRATRAA